LQIGSLQNEAKKMTETLWKEQAKGKQVESELNDARLVIKNMAAENGEMRALMDRERNVN
jgi:hypothetical protein